MTPVLENPLRRQDADLSEAHLIRGHYCVRISNRTEYRTSSDILGR